MDERIKTWKYRLSQMESDRAIFNSQWDDVAKVVMPDAAAFTSDYNTQGKKNNQELYDATGVHANELLAAGFYSLLTSPTQKWFELVTSDERVNADYDVQLWLRDVTDRVYAEISKPQTGFITAVHEIYHSLGAFGNGIMYVTEAADMQSLLFLSLPLQECFFSESMTGRVDTLYRKYKRTAQQLVRTFGFKALSRHVQKLYEQNNTQDKITILHIIEPEPFKRFPWHTAYIELDNDHVIRESGFEECPFMATRFYKTSYEVYGRGPGSSALPDLQMLQQIAKTVLRGAQKIVDPPLMVPDEGFIGNKIRMVPGGISYFRSGLSAEDRIVPIQTGGNPGLGEDLAQGIRNRVRDMFYIDQLQLNDGPQMTATEVLQRTEERMRLLGPVTGRARAELLGPCLERIVGIMRREGKLDEPPDIFYESGANLRVEYQSPMMKAQEQNEANGLLRIAQLISPFMTVDPTVMDVFNSEAIARSVGRMYALDPHYFRSEKEVAAIREQRQQAQQQQAMVEQFAQGGSGLKNMAQGMEALGNMGA